MRELTLCRTRTVKSTILVSMTALLIALSCGAAFADYPERPLRAIVPFTTGGPNDTLARVISPMLAKALGQNVIVENRPGADGRIGIEALAKAAPDGYTILFSGGAVALIPALKRNVPYDPVRDIQPVSELGTSPYVIAVHPQVPAKNVAQLIDLAKKNPGKLNGSSGGNSTFLSLVLFQIQTGTRIVNIPYKGAGDAGLAVVRGEADMAIMDSPAFGHHLQSGRIRMLALAADRRSPTYPDVPTGEGSRIARLHGRLSVRRFHDRQDAARDRSQAEHGNQQDRRLARNLETSGRAGHGAEPEERRRIHEAVPRRAREVERRRGAREDTSRELT